MAFDTCDMLLVQRIDVFPTWWYYLCVRRLVSYYLAEFYYTFWHFWSCQWEDVVWIKRMKISRSRDAHTRIHTHTQICIYIYDSKLCHHWFTGSNCAIIGISELMVADCWLDRYGQISVKLKAKYISVSYRKLNLKACSAKFCPSCLGRSVLIGIIWILRLLKNRYIYS